MTRATAYQKRDAKARQRHRRTAQECLARDRRVLLEIGNALAQGYKQEAVEIPA